MASTVLDPIATAIVNVINGLTLTPAVKSEKWDTSHPKRLPCGIVMMPSLSRTDVDRPEDHLGSNDWRIQFPVNFYFNLGSEQAEQAKAVACVEAFVKAIDADNTLNFATNEAKVITAGPPVFQEDGDRWVIEFPTIVDCLVFVP